MGRKRIRGLWIGMCLSVALMGCTATLAHAREHSRNSADVQRKPYLYGSRYQFCHTYLNTGKVRWTGWNAAEVWNLIPCGEQGNGSVAAYCLDPDIGSAGEAATDCVKINTEDGAYPEPDAVRRLREVLLHSFPYLDVVSIEREANGELGEECLRNLTQGEAIAAAQQAIWEITYAERYQVDDHYISIRGPGEYDSGQFVYSGSLELCAEGEYTESNIENLYRYYLKLEGSSASENETGGDICVYQIQNGSDSGKRLIGYEEGRSMSDRMLWDGSQSRNLPGSAAKAKLVLMAFGSFCFLGAAALTAFCFLDGKWQG